MWKEKIGLGIGPHFGVEMRELMELVKKTGFDAIFTNWQRGDCTAQWAKLAKETGLIYQSIHAPFGKSAVMWGDDAQAGDEAVAELVACLQTCAEVGAPIMVAHAFIGFRDHTPTQAGIDRYGQVAQAAEKLGVKLALENTEGEEYLAALMAAFRGNDTVGFCWDTGHEMCYNHSQDLMALYGDRLLCTHLNDNLGIRDFDGEITFMDDLHLLPFDGIADWQGIAARLDQWNYREILTFELSTFSKPGRHDNDAYGRMPLPEYLAAAFQRACRVATLRRVHMVP